MINAEAKFLGLFPSGHYETNEDFTHYFGPRRRIIISQEEGILFRGRRDRRTGEEKTRSKNKTSVWAFPLTRVTFKQVR